LARGAQPGPLATFNKWKELGRHVKKGEQALMLCIPVHCKRSKTMKNDDGTEQEKDFIFTHFLLQRRCSPSIRPKARNTSPLRFPIGTNRRPWKA
jgi:hypothetical protein